MLVDSADGTEYLVDTGASYSVMPHQSAAPTSGPRIRTADGRPIRCWGKETRPVAAGGFIFQVEFLLADVAFPILGVGFLEAYRLDVSPRRRALLGPGGMRIPLSTPSPGKAAAHVGIVGATAAKRKVAAAPPPLAAGGDSGMIAMAASQCTDPSVFKGYEQLVAKQRGLPPVKHSVEHTIDTGDARPIAQRYRRLDPEKLAAAKKEFAELELQGIVERSDSPWASPLHMVQKADGTWRPCGDYRRLNLVTKPDKYPPPHIEDLTSQLAGKTIFTKLDLRKGYYQIPVAKQDVMKTAVITPFGLFVFRRMPFGLRNAGQSFQRFMDQVLAGVPHVFVYLDDLLVASSSKKEHERDVRAVLDRMKKHGLVLNLEKCVFGVPEVEYLGHQVSAAGLSPLPERVEAITAFPPPTTRAELLGFLGMVNFYRRFIRGAASILRPLTDATRGAGGPKAAVQMTAEMSASFAAAKAALAEATLLAHPRERAEISLVVDASDHHVGAALQQREEAGWRPLSFFSKKLSVTEARYSTFDRELLACVRAIRHFRFQLEGRPFHILTDHKPLTHALHRVSPAHTARQERHLAYIAEFTSDIRHVAGRENVVADTLSRPPAPPEGPAEEAVAAVAPPLTVPPLDWAAISRDQQDDPQVEQLQYNRALQLVKVSMAGHEVLCDVAAGNLRPVLPEGHRQRAFRQVHGIAHPGGRASVRLMNQRYVWLGLAKDVTEWCRQCEVCHRAKVTQPAQATVQKMPIPKHRFSHVHVDLCGPFETSPSGHNRLLTIIDRSTRWFEIQPLAAHDAEAVLEAFVTVWISRYGVPARVTTDRGAQFTSGKWAEYMAAAGVEHITTTAFHPQSNGMVERLHRHLKDALRARGGDWWEQWPYAAMGLRAAPKDESGISTAEAALGHRLVLPGQAMPAEAFPPTGPDHPRHIPATNRLFPEGNEAAETLRQAEWVYIRRDAIGGGPLAPNYEGPYKVLRRREKTFTIRRGQREEVVSVDRLKPHASQVPPTAAEPPRRGRPPRAAAGTAAQECG